MSHLGDRLSALVDGELDGADLDRAHAHLAGCEPCRTEAAELRQLKRKLRELMTRELADGGPAEAAMTSRLVAMTGPGGPVPARSGPARSGPARSGPARSVPVGSVPVGSGPPRRRRLRAVPGRRPAAGPEVSRRGDPQDSGYHGIRHTWLGARRRRYLMLGTVSLVVSLGTAAFTAGGGGGAAPGPRITPPVEMYSVEHAITTGEVPFPGPTAQSAADVPPP
jgi:anti-sigma factor RsiW